MTNDPRQAAIYCRVSTLRQEDEETIEIQRDTLSDHAEKGGHVIVREYCDDGWTGDSLVRPALDLLRQEAKDGLWSTLLIYDPDRLARRYSYQELVMDELKEAGIEIIFVTVSTPKNPEDKIVYGVRGLFAEYERVKIKERFRLGKLRKVKQGSILNSEALYGYTRIPRKDDVNGYYIVNQEEAEVVRMIFSWVAHEGLTMRKVIVRLLEYGIMPRKSKRGVWNTSTLTHMLRNRGYIGEAKWNSSVAIVPKNPLKRERYKRVLKTSKRMLPESEWIIIKIPALIDVDLFEKVQLRLLENFALSTRNTKNEYLLSGKIKCTCGKSRGGEGPKGGQHLYYRCTDRVLSHPLPRTCTEGALNARITDKLVWDELVKLMTSEALLLEQIERFRTDKSKLSNQPLQDDEPLKTELGRLKEELERYNKAYGAGIFTLEELRQYADPLKAKIEKIQSQLSSITGGKKETEVIVSPYDVHFFAEAVKESIVSLSFAEKREIVKSIVEKVVGNKDKLVISGFIPISNVNVQTISRHGMNTIRHNSPSIPFTLEIKFV
jgi:site-specific DNA recombinase